MTDSPSPIKSPTAAMRSPTAPTVSQMELKPQHARLPEAASAAAANQVASSRGQAIPQTDIVESVSITVVSSLTS